VPDRASSPVDASGLIRLATSLAEIGEREPILRSCRRSRNKDHRGDTARRRPASASVMISNSS